MGIKFVTIFPEATNVHLRKDLGKIPYVLYKDFGFDCTFVCFKNEAKYPSLDNDVPGLKMEFLKSKTNKNPLWATIKFLFKNARNIDVLNLYGQSRWVFIIGFLFKKINPQGLLFVKLDMNIEYLQRLQQSLNVQRHLFFWKYFFRKTADIVSSEYQQITAVISSFYEIEPNKIIQITNGVDAEAIAQFAFAKTKTDEKENIILTVGRIGAPEKNHEMLLRAASILDLKEWKIVFIGHIEKQFQVVIDDFFIKNPAKKSSVFFEVEVNDYQLLSRWYNRSKVFCLTSFREGFPVVIPEAMYWGNYIVSTDISSISEILENGKIGSLVSNTNSLVDTLQGIIDNPLSILEKTQLSTHKAEQEYIWSKIVARLGRKILDLKHL